MPDISILRKQSITDLNKLESNAFTAKILENIAKMPEIDNDSPEVIETESMSDANYIEDLMNMSMNLDRLPKEMMASVSSNYAWEGRKSPN
jgi:hypothetical protein